MDAQPTAENELRIPPRTAPRRRLLLAGLTLLVVAAGITAFLLTRSGGESPYRVAAVTETDIIKEIRVTGHLELSEEVEVPAPIEGQLVSVQVQPGDGVEQGQLLGQLDRAQAELAFHIARAEMHATRARVLEAEAAAQRAAESLARTTRLVAKDLASRAALEQARTAATKASAGLEAARAEQSAAAKRASLRERERDRTDIVAPRAGVVLEVPKNTGMVVGPAHRLFRIGAAPTQMLISAPIGEADIGEVRVGQRASFEVPAYPGRLFEASVSHLSPDPDVRAGAVFYTVTLTTENADGALLSGMTAQIRIQAAKVQGVLAVREAALRFTPEGAPDAPPRSRVWRLDGEVLEEVAVEVGLSDGAFTEVRAIPPQELVAGDPIAIGIATRQVDGVAPGVSLRGSQ